MATTETARSASVARKTNETDISVSLSVDGNRNRIHFDRRRLLRSHARAAARHSLIDMRSSAKGDLHIDDHHTVEDTGIALGQALAKALGDRRGITRYAARSCHGRNADPRRHRRFRPAVSGLGCRFHRPRRSAPSTPNWCANSSRLSPRMPASRCMSRIFYGANSHHIAETCFKAVARVLRTAVEIDPRQADAIPSTKGTLNG
jgi:imidazoleglycerol-phosphate dehydratase